MGCFCLILIFVSKSGSVPTYVGTDPLANGYVAAIF